MRNRVNQMHGPYRRPVGDARTAVSSEAADRWARPAVARHACGAERCVLGFAHGRSLARSARLAIRPIKPVIDASNSGSAPGCSTRLLQTLAEDLRDRGKLDLSESFIDASFSSAKKGALLSALLDAAKAAKSWRSQTAMVFLSPCTWPALRLMKPNSSKPRSQRRFLRPNSGAIDRRPRLRQRSAGSAHTANSSGVQLIAPHKLEPRRRPATQDGRALRRYRRRWKIERLFAWLHNFRRIVIRWEYYPDNFLGMVQLACAVILLRHL